MLNGVKGGRYSLWWRQAVTSPKSGKDEGVKSVKYSRRDEASLPPEVEMWCWLMRESRSAAYLRGAGG